MSRLDRVHDKKALELNETNDNTFTTCTPAGDSRSRWMINESQSWTTWCSGRKLIRKPIDHSHLHIAQHLIQTLILLQQFTIEKFNRSLTCLLKMYAWILTHYAEQARYGVNRSLHYRRCLTLARKCLIPSGNSLKICRRNCGLIQTGGDTKPPANLETQQMMWNYEIKIWNTGELVCAIFLLKSLFGNCPAWFMDSLRAQSAP